jgi:hypothetical protein
MIETFLNTTGHGPVADTVDGIDYPASSAPMNMQLSIMIADNFTSTIPPYELTNLKRGTAVSDIGTYGILNSSLYQVGIKSVYDPVIGEEKELLLGGIFLSMNYLVVNIDAGIFKLAPVNPRAPSHGELQPICAPPSRKTVNYKVAFIAGFASLLVALITIIFLWRKLSRKSGQSQQGGSQFGSSSSPPMGERLPASAANRSSGGNPSFFSAPDQSPQKSPSSASPDRSSQEGSITNSHHSSTPAGSHQSSS